MIAPAAGPVYGDGSGYLPEQCLCVDNGESINGSSARGDRPMSDPRWIQVGPGVTDRVPLEARV